jgi:DNA-binding CsgD family transcriptional regulator/tetratricopeptide (TPR) repeat protein
MGGRVASPTFVGRIEELELLEAARGRAADADPAVVLVGGEAGVGKTRLVAELTSRCTANRIRVLVGGCVPVGEGALPYAPIVAALRGLLGEVGVGAVRELVGPSWPELARLLPALGAPDHTGQPDQAAQARLFELLLGLLGRLGDQAPLVLVVEDLHWADRSTRDLLAFLVRNLRRERVLLMVTYRNDEPGQQRLGPYLAELDRASRVERIELARLDQTQTGAQLVGILKAAPTTELVDAVFARSEGNPFFTEELLAVVRAGSGELPVTLRDLLRGRVQTLPEPARRVLEVVAVAGRQVSHRLLAAVAGLDDAQLEGALRAAVAHQLLVTDGDGYDVRHALLREVMYADLLPGERMRLHARLAQALSEQPELAAPSPAVAAAELAAHWDAAGDLERSLSASVEAGRQAERTFAFAEALRHYERALDLWARVPQAAELASIDRATLLEHAAEAAQLVDQHPRAAELVRAALAAVDSAGDPVRAGLLHERLGRYLWMTLDDAALAAYEEAVRLVPAEPPSAERARVLAAYAQVLYLLGQGAEGRRVAKEALAVARRVGARREEGRALGVAGVALGNLGDVDGALAFLHDARRIAEDQADLEGLVRACVMLAWVSEDAGRLEEGLQASLDGAEAIGRLGSPGWRDFLLGDAADFEFMLGRWDQADRHLRAILERDRLTGTKGVHTRWRRARLDIARGDFAAARRWLKEAEELASKAGPAQFDAQFGCPLAQTRAELALWEGRNEEAAEAVRQGLAAVRQVGDEARCPILFMLGLAAAAARGERALARRASAEAEAVGRDGEELLARLEALGDTNASFPAMAAVLLQCRAEHARLHGRPDPAAWAAAAHRWESLGQPYPTACARWREAEALLAGRAPKARVEEALRAAYVAAVQLEAVPLRRELELLAQRGRVRLEPPAQPAPVAEADTPSVTRSLGLTRRETEVLVLLTEGRTNRQIGQDLFITEKTASVHVSRILAKLGVTGRGEAAAIAHRLGLDKQ